MSGFQQQVKGTRVWVLALLVPILVIMLLTPAGCANSSPGDETNSSNESSASVPLRVSIGTMVTEDFLPMWVAESEGLFAAAGLDASIETFQSAQELSTALAAGAIDMAMTDIMVSATLCAADSPVQLEWVTLGTTSEQGRFGIMTSPNSGYRTLNDLAGVPIGVGSNTVLEYMMDKLMEAAGVPADQIIAEEIKKIPVRYEMMVADQVAAAALPGSLLSLGEATGMVLIADDRGEQNLSSSVMISRAAFAASAEGQVAIDSIAQIWDEAANRINAAPEAFRAVLVEKAQLPEPVWESYPISSYPLAERPSAALVDPVLEWMLAKGYLQSPLSYDFQTGAFNS